MKTFDCIQMKRDAQKKIREAVKGMTPEQEIAFFREGAEEFERQIEQAAKNAGHQEKES
jgi:soluble cytochrome b562